MSGKHFERYTGKPYLKGIVAKVALAMAIMTLLVTIISASSYVMLKNANDDSGKKLQRQVLTSLLSSSMLRYSAEMNIALYRYSTGQSNTQAMFNEKKAKIVQAFEDLEEYYGKNNETIRVLQTLFVSYTRQADSTVILPFNPQDEVRIRKKYETLQSEQYNDLLNLVNEMMSSLSVTESSDERAKLYLEEMLIKSRSMLTAVKSHINGIPGGLEFVNSNNVEFFQYLGLYQGAFGQSDLLEQLQMRHKALYDSAISIFNDYDPSKKVEASRAVAELTDTIYKELIENLTSFAENGNIDAFDTINKQQSVLQTNQTSFMALFAIIALASVLITLSVYRNVTRPIAKLADTMFQLSQGNTEVPIMFRNRRDEVGQISYALSLFRDHIISRNQAREQLVYQKERAESASLAKAQFLAAMSHEIRTPMNGVIGMIDILRRSNLDATQLGLANTVRESALTLLGIINDILDFSRIEAGKMSLDQVPFAIRNIAEQVMDNFAAEAMSKNVKLSLFVDPKLSSSLIGDPIRIKQILFNLIGNGIKFSSRKGHTGIVQVWVFAVDTEHASEHTEIKIEVRDNGIGISQEKLAAIFQPFTQAEYSTTRRFGGSGLGLAISRNIINMLNGNISVSSEEGFGTTFVVNFALPCAETTEDAPDFKSQVEKLKTFSLINTLGSGPLHSMVDKYLPYLDLLPVTIPIHQLEKDASGFSADEHYIVLCDDYLFTKKQLEQHKHLNIKYLEMDTRLPVHKYGATDVFSIHASPLKLSRLIEGLQICAGVKSPDFPVFHSQPKAKLREPKVTNRARILVAEDNLTNQIVIEKQLTYLGYQVTMTENGVEAEDAYQKEKFDIVLTDCHMPELDGYQLTKHLRNIQKKDKRWVPIVALTANALVGEAEKCEAAGMDDFISKPVEMDDIQGVLDKWLKAAKERTDDTSALLETQVDQKPLIDLAPTNNNQSKFALRENVLEKLFWGDESTYLAVLNEFNRHCVPELSRLADYSIPFEFEEVRQAAHKLKTSTSSVGADYLSELCKRIELASREESNELDKMITELKRVLPECLKVVEEKRSELEASAESDQQ
ncbi:hybrid sensor histidine kinase/response regulator [Veronia nyctiphanis]|uniref:Sensory/regulatory protein RpfC n=1 Tax=Veronia nyctiphanis TaxID=1278244 RepID=A0A4Q0YSQ2_9GAMM|nr:ATP-binding protein [Veronia nyctiphanis]RXJ74277.1 hybrid sensor histidine kinase/response regulator [Veronia nyctiphanis]